MNVDASRSVRPHAVDWLLAKHDHALGDVFHSVWCRQLIDAEPSVWEIRLNGGQELPAHLFQLQTVQYFTAGSVSIGGERDCTEGDIRWADGNVASGSWKVASLGARFYLIGMDGTLQAAARQMADVKKIERWQCRNPCELEWAETVDHKHLSPPGRLCARVDLQWRCLSLIPIVLRSHIPIRAISSISCTMIR